MKISVFVALVLSLCTSMELTAQTVTIKAEEVNLREPINTEIVKEAIALLNIVFNTVEFKEQLKASSFVCTNRPTLCDSTGIIQGSKVFAEFIESGPIALNLRVKKLRNPWKRRVSKTLGETPPTDNTITTYTWWLDGANKKDLVIAYATHIGHEMFHTKHFKYIHDPEYGSKDFVNDQDVTYRIDDIIEALITKYYKD